MNKTLLQDVFTAFLVCSGLFFATNVNDFAQYYSYFILSFFILFSLILYKLFTSYKKTIVLPVNKYLIFYLLFLIFAALSVLWSPVPGDSLMALSMFYMFPVGVILGFWSNTKQQKYFQFFLILLLLVIFGKSIQQRFFLEPSLYPFGFFANKNTNAIFVCMLILPLCAKFLGKEINNNNQYLVGGFLFIGAFIISLTISRGALLGLGIGGLILLTHSLYFKLPRIQFIKLVSYLSAGYLLADWLNGSKNIGSLAKNTANINISSISSGRNNLWKSGWEMYQDQPFIGWGLNMYKWLFPQYRHVNAPDPGLYAHNDYFQVLIELGPIGFILFIGFIVYLLITLKKVYVVGKNQEQKLIFLGFITAVIGVLAHSFFTFNLYQPATLLLLGLYAGVLTQNLNKLTSTKNIQFVASETNYVSTYAYYSLVTVLSLVLIYVTTINAVSVKKVYAPYKNILTALDESEFAYSLTSYKESILSTQLDLYTDLLYNEANDPTAKSERFLTNRAIKVSKQAIEKNPYRVSNYINRGKLFFIGLKKDYPKREQEINLAYQQAIKVDPFNIKARLDYAKVLVSFNKKNAAIKILEGGLGRKYYGNYEDAISYLQELKSLYARSNNQQAILDINQQIKKLQRKKGIAGFLKLVQIKT